MATITIHPEHVDGLRALARFEFERACEEESLTALRELIDLEDRIAWGDLAPPAWDRPGEVCLSDAFLERFVTLAWEVGNERLASLYSCRARGTTLPDGYATDSEREARSMHAFHENMQGEGMVV